MDESHMSAVTEQGEPQPERFMARTKSFTRRGGRMPDSLERTFAAHGPHYVIELQRDGGYTTVAADEHFDQKAVFGRVAPLVIEVGSGAGDQIVASAAARPDWDFLAFEVWVPGIAKTVSRAVHASIDNVRLIEADAVQAFPILFPDAIATEVWTFFPDPWRKARHHKRRLVQASFAAEVARVLADDGIWRLATDWADYAWQMRDVVEAETHLVNPYRGQNPHPQDPESERGGFAPRWDGRVDTRFERRGQRAGREVFDVEGVRVAR